MSYSLTEKQKEGLEICIKRYKENKPYTIIAGYAGTGKSFLINRIVEKFGFQEDEVAYACYTGKAALVLQNQGKNAVTLHKLLYISYPDGYGGFVTKPLEELDSNLKLIVVDEISMCPKEMWYLLLSHHIYVIGLGDPFQLPPIGDELHLLDKPHIFLTEVMRQALDSDIIKYSMSLRENKDLQVGINGNDIKVLPKSSLNVGMLKWADQILCAKNSVRKDINSQMRKILGKNGIIDEEDKMICTKNYWGAFSDKGDCLVNGSIGKVHFVTKTANLIKANFQLETMGNFDNLLLDYNLLEKGKPTVVKDKKGKIINSPYRELDYGYAITVHKAQGSQFDKVLVYDDYWEQGEQHRRWLYTAITRAIHKVVVLM